MRGWVVGNAGVSLGAWILDIINMSNICIEGEMEGREAGGQRGALRRDRRPQAKPPTLRPLG